MTDPGTDLCAPCKDYDRCGENARPCETKAIKPVVNTWTLADSRAACKEGWDIFDCGGRYEIERNEERPGRCKDMTDDEIVVWLIGRALRGNRLATKAILHLMVIDPSWTAADISSMAKKGYLVAKNADGKIVVPASFIEYHKEPPKPNKPGTWEDDFTQFARLIAEFNAAGAPSNKQLKLMMESMDLTEEDIHELLDRAEAAWFKIKEKLR